MRRREVLNIWPAIADLMTILAVPALCVSVGRFAFSPAQSNIPGSHRVIDPPPVELPKNERMFRAIQRAEDFVREVHAVSGLALDQDQSLRFGDDLVGFARDSDEPVWKADSRERLRTYCGSISATLRRRPEMRDRFLILVEGHADSSSCHGSMDCNWPLSARRAASFLLALQRPEVCPEGSRWALRPMGFAATQPLAGRGSGRHRDADRRIALRLLPDYRQIIEDVTRDQKKR